MASKSPKSIHRLWPPIVPHEHGSWGTLGGLILACLLVLGVNTNVLLTLITGLALFLAREPLSLFMRMRFGRQPQTVPWSILFWAATYLGIGGLTAALLVFVIGLEEMVWLGLAGMLVLTIHLFIAPKKRWVMSAWGEWIGVLGISLIIPALYLAVRETLDNQALGLWLLGLAQVTGPIFYIRLKVRIQARSPETPSVGQRLRAGWVPLLFSAISLGGAYFLGRWQWTPSSAWLALMPSAIKHIWGTWRWTPRGQLDIRRLGWIEVANILLFAIILGVIYRFS